MKALLRELTAIDGVRGAVVLDPSGNTVAQSLSDPALVPLTPAEGASIVRTFGDIGEAELVYEHFRVYMRKAGSGLLQVFMDESAQMAMVRINCNILIPAIEEKMNRPKGLARFFRKK